MPDRFATGDRVIVSQADPPGHRRAPRYVRGQVGTITAMHGRHTLPDDVVARVAVPRVEPVYAVAFPAHTLWGSGDHTVTVNLWETYLDRAVDGV
ncbi:MAG TPA: SH3-like domain-containing protein [Candidatus Dormibacteraeota bacterium]